MANAYFCKTCSTETTIANNVCVTCNGNNYTPVDNTVTDTGNGDGGVIAPSEPNLNDDNFETNNKNESSSGDGEKKGFFDFLNIFKKDDGEDPEKLDEKMFGDNTNTDDEILKHSVYGGAYGIYDGSQDEAMSNKLETHFNSTSGEIMDNDFDRNIIGLPLFYNKTADPNRRVFMNTLMYNAPLVYIIPGKPKLNNKLISQSNGAFTIDLDEYYNNADGEVENGNPGGIAVLRPKSGDDLRYLAFRNNYTQYWNYVQILGSYVHSWINTTASDENGLNGSLLNKYNFSDEFKMKHGNYGLCYFADRATTTTESAENSYASSRIAEAVGEKTTITREASMVGNYGKFTEFTNSIYQNLASMVTNAGATADSLKSFEGILTKTANQFIKIVNGAQLDFPDVWQDSKFNRSYNVSMKFYSPYGDKASIMKYVYTPFLSLLALVLPRQDQAFTYVEPFLVRMFCPGRFNIDMGVITSMSIQKGGPDNLWTADGLPQCIEITLDIQDLYPALRQISKANQMKYNKNLSMYLETMAGIRSDVLTSSTLKAWVNRKLSNSIISNFDEKLENIFDSAIYSVNNKVAGLFKN